MPGGPGIGPGDPRFERLRLGPRDAVGLSRLPLRSADPGVVDGKPCLFVETGGARVRLVRRPDGTVDMDGAERDVRLVASMIASARRGEAGGGARD